MVDPEFQRAREGGNFGTGVLFSAFICSRAGLARSFVPTVTGVIAFRTPEVSRRVIWHFLIEKLVSSKVDHSKVTHVPCASIVIHVPVM